MDFSFTESQRLLQDSVSRLLAEPPSSSAAAPSTGDRRRSAWFKFTELGLLGLPFAEADGGFGGGPVETMIVMQALGRAGSVEPYLATAVLSATLLRLSASPAQRQALFDRIIGGDLQLAFAHSEQNGRCDAGSISCAARRESGGWRLDGRKTDVMGADAAGMLIVSALTEEPSGFTLFAVERDEAGVAASPFALRDGSRSADIDFVGVRLSADAMLGPAGEAWPVISAAIDHAIAALAAESVGAMEAILELTLSHLRTRRQFGRPLGDFQALQHRAAEMYIELEQARSLAMFAACALGERDDDRRAHATSMAKAGVGAAARFVAQQGVQLHGGMGMTDEHPIGRYFRRLMVIERTFGDTMHHVEQIARRTDLIEALAMP